MFDFVFKRIFPKLPIFKVAYFAVTKGLKRILSKCEILGRLSYCGFKIVDYAEIDNKLYFIGMKVRKPSADESPSYGPLIKMRRVSKDGKYIYVYKLRTMHPYAEYLHSYMIEKNGYNENGKIKNDFRVTSWAKFIRKFYLDEMPQLINFLKGELSIIGVRPVSDVYLREYPDEIRNQRDDFKPGCIPPYVALKMPGKEGCIESERIYMMQKKKHPIWTDVKFFTLSVYNILTKKVHSK
jgi:lipopolysaccharide/colanic/teichoic acid biosynthesis glycosyltransferase